MGGALAKLTDNWLHVRCRPASAGESPAVSRWQNLTTVSSWLFIPSPFAALHFPHPTTVHIFSFALVFREVKEHGQWRAEAAAAEVLAESISKNSPAKTSCQWVNRWLEIWEGRTGLSIAVAKKSTSVQHSRTHCTNHYQAISIDLARISGKVE